MTMEKREICLAVERTVGKAMMTPRDFDQLAEAVYEKIHEQLSPSTLKRLWGYLDTQIEPRLFTLNVLSHFVGYDSYEAFCQRNGEAESNLVASRRLSVETLRRGQQVRLTWPPDRVCVIEHLGDGRFTVVEAANTKLSVGDTFECHLFIEREPLYVDNLVHLGGGVPMAYVAGRDNGVMFETV